MQVRGLAWIVEMFPKSHLFIGAIVVIKLVLRGAGTQNNPTPDSCHPMMLPLAETPWDAVIMAHCGQLC